MAEMGQSPSCGRAGHDHFLKAVEAGDLAMVESSLRMDPDILHHTTLYDRLSPLHIAAANGGLEVGSLPLRSKESSVFFFFFSRPSWVFSVDFLVF